MTEEPAASAPHIRPTVRRKGRAATAASPVRSETASQANVNSAVDPDNTAAAGEPEEKRVPRSILKQPKYSSGTPTAAAASSPAPPFEEHDDLLPPAPPIVQEQVLERPRTHSRAKQQQQASSLKASASAVEGYSPSSLRPKNSVTDPKERKTQFVDETKVDSTDAGIDPDSPLVLNSLADLMQEAGTLDENDTNEPPAVVEATLEFSCVDPAEWEREREQPDPTEPETDDDDENSPENDDDDSWDGFFDFSPDGAEQDDTSPPQKRAFLQLWTILSQYITPAAVTYVRQLRSGPEQEPSPTDGRPVMSDIESSRCTGLLALLQMHIAGSLTELGRPAEQQRLAEQRLLHLLQSFNYGRAVEWDSRLARALTCVLLESLLLLEPKQEVDESPSGTVTTLKATTLQVPNSCQVLDMTPEEYRYLTRSAIVDFDTTYPVEDQADGS